MPTYIDKPDFEQSVTPGVVRWAPGTEFGAVSWNGAVTALTEHVVYYEIPDDGYRYVMDKSFIKSDYVGMLQMDLSVCPVYTTPAWSKLCRVVGDGTFEFSPFAFVSMSLIHPQGIKWQIFNYNNVGRTFYLTAGFYRYSSIG